MLLQKREENAITLAATANNGRFVETPQASVAPVSPRKAIILLIAMMLGFIIPFIIMFLRDFLNYKIENRSDIERLTTVPVVGWG